MVDQNNTNGALSSANSRHGLLLPLFLVLSLLGVALRVYLKLVVVDPFTGFYEGSTQIVFVFRLLIGGGILALLLLGWRNGSKATGRIQPSRFTCAASAASGAAAILLSLVSVFDLAGEFAFWGISDLTALLFHLVGAVSGGVLLYIGFAGSALQLGGGWLLFPLVWQVYFLLRLFMQYTASRSVSDQLLTIVMLLCLVPFLLAHGRLLGGIEPEKGARQIYLFGLPYALTALTLSAGIVAGALAQRSVVVALGLWEAIFYFLLGLYAAGVVFSLCRK